jgi:hypothetical protein
MENPVVKVSKKKQGAHVPSARAFFQCFLNFGTFSHITLLAGCSKETFFRNKLAYPTM